MRMLLYPTPEAELIESVRGVSQEVTVLTAASEEEARTRIADVEALYGIITPALFAEAKRLRWIQTPMAGLESYFFPELIESDIVVTNQQGIFSDVIADHVIGLVMCFARGLHLAIRAQERRVWLRNIPLIHLGDQTAGIVGIGGIGTEVARRCHTSGMRVIATDPVKTERPTFVDALWGQDRLPDLLREADFVLVCVPQTPETTGMFGPEQFAGMKQTAHFVNIGRGKVVSLHALTDALRSGVIAGAALDVFEIEPLPSDHPLWGMPNVIITPHMAGESIHIAERRNATVCENLRRFVADQPLKNVVDKRRGC
jgi:phosphoglycerate dehydrogenase-like enzyme